MRTRVFVLGLGAALGGLALPAFAEKFTLLTGVDAGRYPGAARSVFPEMGPPGSFFDGDRLAGTPDVGPTVAYVGLPPGPLYDPNEFGSLSFLFRRGSVPLGPGGQLPLLGIEFLGGPLLDLDGDLGDDSRSLVPVSGQSPVEVPGSAGFLDLEFQFDPQLHAGTVRLHDFDATATNEGGPGIQPEIATVLINIAGTGPLGEKTGPINPSVDTRSGAVAPFAGSSGSLLNVFEISGLGFELWEDTIDPASATAAVLGTLQQLGTFRGWLVVRDAQSGQFPALAGEGLGSTLWPLVNDSQQGGVFNTANGLFGGTATIAAGATNDAFTGPGEGGEALTAFGGDLGAYLDAVVVPLVPADSNSFVYLEAAGFGINNSGDPVFRDTIAYDAVIIAASAGCTRCDSNCDGLVNFDDIDCFVAGLIGEPAWQGCGHRSGCAYSCVNDTNADGGVNFDDIDGFILCLIGG